MSGDSGQHATISGNRQNRTRPPRYNTNQSPLFPQVGQSCLKVGQSRPAMPQKQIPQPTRRTKDSLALPNRQTLPANS